MDISDKLAVSGPSALYTCEKQPEVPEVYLFVSFDLVGSTKMKTVLPTKKWVGIVNYFYNLLERTVGHELKGKVWKHVGDEVLFYQKTP